MCTVRRPSRGDWYLLVLLVALVVPGQTGWGAPHGVIWAAGTNATAMRVP